MPARVPHMATVREAIGLGKYDLQNTMNQQLGILNLFLAYVTFYLSLRNFIIHSL